MPDNHKTSRRAVLWRIRVDAPVRRWFVPISYMTIRVYASPQVLFEFLRGLTLCHDLRKLKELTQPELLSSPVHHGETLVQFDLHPIRCL